MARFTTGRSDKAPLARGDVALHWWFRPRPVCQGIRLAAGGGCFLTVASAVFLGGEACGLAASDFHWQCSVAKLCAVIANFLWQRFGT